MASVADQHGSLTDTEFSAAVAAVTSAFGDPTRRQIYFFVRDHEDGVTASEVADRFTLHSNVARHHLDKLTAGGYLEVTVLRLTGGGAGRPSKLYRKSAQDTGLSAP
ncbi:MAG TPA: helix-turn-helix domain-containing protein, partial [Acidimicrobiales bacterium]|nr:helix-turn-helix domain-containing protein [Acidimicrobiales bacterium]